MYKLTMAFVDRTVMVPNLNVKQCPSLKAHLGFNPPLANVSKESACDWWTLSRSSKNSVPSAWLRASQERKERREKHQVRGVWIRDQGGFRTGAIHQHFRTFCQSSRLLGKLILACWICFKGLVNGYVRTWRHSPHLDFDWKGNYYTLLIPRPAPQRGQRTRSWEKIEGLCSPSLWTETTLNYLLVWKFHWKDILAAFWLDAPLKSVGSSCHRGPVSSFWTPSVHLTPHLKSKTKRKCTSGNKVSCERHFRTTGPQ